MDQGIVERQAKDGARLQYLSGGGIEPLQAQSNGISNGVWHWKICQVGQLRQLATGLDKASQDLENEKWIAARDLLEPVSQDIVIGCRSL
jgi:hypothetical protein